MVVAVVAGVRVRVRRRRRRRAGGRLSGGSGGLGRRVDGGGGVGGRRVGGGRGGRTRAGTRARAVSVRPADLEDTLVEATRRKGLEEGLGHVERAVGARGALVDDLGSGGLAVLGVGNRDPLGARAVELRDVHGDEVVAGVVVGTLTGVGALGIASAKWLRSGCAGGIMWHHNSKRTLTTSYQVAWYWTSLRGDMGAGAARPVAAITEKRARVLAYMLIMCVG